MDASHLFAALLFLTLAGSSRGIGCYVCTSVNGDNPDCEDPFNATYISDENKDFYVEDCKSGRKHRNGLFPASVCVKVKGKYWSDGQKTVLIRTCSVDSNSLTMDTELSRVAHSCGLFDFVANANSTTTNPSRVEKSQRMSGCIDVCDDSEGCNTGCSIFSTNSFTLAPYLVFLILQNILK